MIALTREAGAFVAGMRFESIDPKALAMLHNGFADCAAAIILGRNEPVVRILRSVSPGGAGESRLCFGIGRAPAPQAALVNGAAAHSLDYDDIGLNGLQPTHPSAVLVPAILAEGEALGSSGRELLTAYATGYELWGELACRERSPYHLKGWHPTATFGVIAAAAAAAKLHRLDAARATNAIAIGASQAGGVVANFGTMTKPFHAGRAASAGVLSARLAAAGMTGSAQVLEHPRGFLKAMSPAGEVDLDAPVRFATHSWLLAEGLGFKLYPMCYGAHRALDAIIALAREHDIAADAVDRVVIEATELQLANLVHHDPQIALHAKFSMEFAAAMALIARRATRVEVQDSFVQRADVRALMKKVHLELQPPGPPCDGVIVTLKDGTRFERRFDHPLGHARRPAGAQALWNKFEDCTQGALSAADARRLFELLQRLEQLRSFNELPVVE